MSDVTLNPSITPSFTPSSGVQSAQTPAPEAVSPSYTPLWMVNDSIGSNAFEMLGMRLPNASGDIAAILGQISLTLDQTMDESRKNQAMASLAKLFSALGSIDLESLREQVDRRQKGVDDAKTRFQNVATSTGNYATQRGNLSNEIATLQAQLAAAKDADKPAIQVQLNAKLTERDNLDISVATTRIDALNEQIGDLESQLQAAQSGSTEATRLSEMIASLKDTRDSLVQLRSTFSAGRPNSVTAGNNFANAVQSQYDAAVASLNTKLGEERTRAGAELDTASAAAVAFIAMATATQTTENVNAFNSQSDVDSETERRFEKIADELKDVAARTRRTLENLASRQEGESPAPGGLDAMARGLLAALNDILRALDGLDAAGAGSPPPGPTVGNRLRLGI